MRPLCAVATCPGCNDSVAVAETYHAFTRRFQDRLVFQRVFCPEDGDDHEMLVVIDGCHRRCGSRRWSEAGRAALRLGPDGLEETYELLAREISKLRPGGKGGE